jgi:hypothetical protein
MSRPARGHHAGPIDHGGRWSELVGAPVGASERGVGVPPLAKPIETEVGGEPSPL